MSVSVIELAKSFDADVMSRYGVHFGQFLAEAVDQRCSDSDDENAGDEASAPGDDENTSRDILDLSCGTGAFCLPLLKEFPEDTRLIALSGDRFSLRVLHDKLSPEDRQQVFPRKENIKRLPFAANHFQNVIVCLPTHPVEKLRAILRTGMRMLREGGQLLLCLPLHGSFQSLLAAFGESGSESSGETNIQQLLAERLELKGLDEWTKVLRNLGAVRITAEEKIIEFEAQTPLSEDRLLAHHLLPIWLGEHHGRNLQNQLEQITQLELPVHVNVGIFSAYRGSGAIEETTVS